MAVVGQAPPQIESADQPYLAGLAERPDGGDQLGDGALLDLEGQGGDPFDEAAVSGTGEGRCEGPAQSLPEGPYE